MTLKTESLKLIPKNTTIQPPINGEPGFICHEGITYRVTLFEKGKILTSQSPDWQAAAEKVLQHLKIKNLLPDHLETVELNFSRSNIVKNDQTHQDPQIDTFFKNDLKPLYEKINVYKPSPTPHLSSSSQMQPLQQGLPNLGSTCYINSALQSLLNLDNFIQDIRQRECQGPLQSLRDNIIWLSDNIQKSSADEIGNKIRNIITSLHQIYPITTNSIKIGQSGDASEVLEAILSAFNYTIPVEEQLKTFQIVDKQLREIESSSQSNPISMSMPSLDLHNIKNENLQETINQTYEYNLNQRIQQYTDMPPEEQNNFIFRRTVNRDQQSLTQIYQNFIKANNLPPVITVKFVNSTIQSLQQAQTLTLPIYDNDGNNLQIAHLELSSFICYSPGHFYTVVKDASGNWINKNDSRTSQGSLTGHHSIVNACYKITKITQPTSSPKTPPT